MNARVKIDPAGVRENSTGCPAEAIGRRIEKMEVAYSVNDRAGVGADAVQEADCNARELALLDLGRKLGADLEWVKAETVRGAFVQLMQLQDVHGDLDNAEPHGPDYQRLLRSRDRLMALIGATLVDLGEIGPEDFGRRFRWRCGSVTREILRDQVAIDLAL